MNKHKLVLGKPFNADPIKKIHVVVMVSKREGGRGQLGLAVAGLYGFDGHESVGRSMVHSKD